MLAGDMLAVRTASGQKTFTLTQSSISLYVFRYLEVNRTYFQLLTDDNLLRYTAASGEDNIEIALYTAIGI